MLINFKIFNFIIFKLTEKKIGILKQLKLRFEVDEKTLIKKYYIRYYNS